MALSIGVSSLDAARAGAIGGTTTLPDRPTRCHAPIHRAVMARKSGQSSILRRLRVTDHPPSRVMACEGAAVASTAAELSSDPIAVLAERRHRAVLARLAGALRSGRRNRCRSGRRTDGD